VPEIRSAEVLERQREGRPSLAGFTAASGSRVTFRLTISHPLPLPRFVRRRVIDGLVAGTLRGLAEHVARAPAGQGRGGATAATGD
jgi:hypothetical protein